jgi:hypothetical protein
MIRAFLAGESSRLRNAQQTTMSGEPKRVTVLQTVER